MKRFKSSNFWIGNIVLVIALLFLLLFLFGCSKTETQPEQPPVATYKLITMEVDLPGVGLPFIVVYNGIIDTIHEDWTKQIEVQQATGLTMKVSSEYNRGASASIKVLDRTVKSGESENARLDPIWLSYSW